MGIPRTEFLTPKDEHLQYLPGDFGFIPNYDDRLLISNAFHAIGGTSTGFQNNPNWIALRSHKPPTDSGFMFWATPPKELQNVIDIVTSNYPGHSGTTFGWTMRHLQYIASEGWLKYTKSWIATPSH